MKLEDQVCLHTFLKDLHQTCFKSVIHNWEFHNEDFHQIFYHMNKIDSMQCWNVDRALNNLIEIILNANVKYGKVEVFYVDLLEL